MTGHTVADHFVDITEMVGIGLGAQRAIEDWALSRYACYHTAELAANLFRTTQAEDKLRQEYVRSKDRASQIHKEVGRKVRQTIRELGGTMPENLPTAESIRMVESREKKRLKAERKRALPGPPRAE
jgi:hypothetical protein